MVNVVNRGFFVLKMGECSKSFFFFFENGIISLFVYVEYNNGLEVKIDDIVVVVKGCYIVLRLLYC